MAPERWPAPLAEQGPLNVGEQGARLSGLASVRRYALLLLILSQTALAVCVLRDALPYHGATLLEASILILSGILFLWLSAGFWTAVAGFAMLMLGGDRKALAAGPILPDPAAAPCRTAIVMPICNEDVERTFAGLRATCLSLAATGAMRHFEFFILSDSSDAATRRAEFAAWRELSQSFGESARIHYRWRRHHIKRKSGNIADFCRRWGANFRYMVVLDADSVMSGGSLTRLVGLMEANPQAGIIQTTPCAIGRETLYARVQQFAGRTYGPLFSAGLHFWQLGESHYWGHNAIIRVAPFMKHCALGRLRGRRGASQEILSHDFAEAALMRRAGWGVWIAYDISGSYEETPPSLIEELQRDRRWCHGNMINFRLLRWPGIHTVHRAMFATGALSYATSLLWLLSMVCSTLLVAMHTLAEPTYFSMPNQLFPDWPRWDPRQAAGLLAATGILLFGPKLLSIAYWIRRGAAPFGGVAALTVNVAMESAFSALLAPVRMMFHAWFVFSALIGKTTHWRSPPRSDVETGWSEAWQRHGLHCAIAAAWACIAWQLHPFYLLWVMPVLGPLLLAIPVSVLSSRVSLGRVARAIGLFLTPEETSPPQEWLWVRSAQPVPPRMSAPVLPRLTDGVASIYAHAPE